MKHNYWLLAIILMAGLLTLTACKSDEESNVQTNNQASENNSEQNSNNDTTSNGEIQSEDSNDNQLNDQDKTSNAYEGDSPPSNQTDNQKELHTRADYLKKLNEMEEADKMLESGETTTELEAQEEERYAKWDEELNTIYQVINEQVSKEKKENLKAEQRNWIEMRDETAEKESQKYEGGATESLEYIATQATLTRERCYALVAKYMD